MDILLVEDDMTLFKELSEELEQWDFQVHGISDFNDVMSKFEAVNAAIVIMDVKLPKYDGFYWTRKIREVSNSDSRRCTPHLYRTGREAPPHSFTSDTTAN